MRLMFQIDQSELLAQIPMLSGAYSDRAKDVALLALIDPASA
jgi:hypothetical protein